MAGGYFTMAGAVGANRIAYWDGASWQAFGLGISGSACSSCWPAGGSIYDTAPFNGQLIAAGSFTTAGTGVSSYLARWGCGTTNPPSDCNDNAQVNLQDYTGFPNCLSGPLLPSEDACGCYRLDGDADVDLRDFMGFANGFTGG